MGGIFQILVFAFCAEVGALPAGQYTGGPQNLPGGYSTPESNFIAPFAMFTIPSGYPFTTQISDAEERTAKLNIEIQNGRAAMLGVFGCMCHSCVDSCDHHFSTRSPTTKVAGTGY